MALRIEAYEGKTKNTEAVMLEKIAEHFGVETQVIKTIEEMAELTVALCKGDKTSAAEEIADVEIMLAQIKHLLEIDTTEIREEKIRRTIDRIDNGFYTDCQWR